MDFVTINPTPTTCNVTRTGQFAKVVYFNNRSGLAIKVNYPNGEHVSIPAINEQISSRKFEIHVEYLIENGCTIATLKDILSDSDYKVVEEALPENRKIIRIKYVVSDIAVLESGKGIYLENLSMALTPDNSVGCKYPKGVSGADNNSFDLKIVVVDHGGIICGQYIKFLDYIFEAAHSLGTGLGDGIYLMSTFRGVSNVTKYELDPDKGPIRVFRSLQVAKAYEGYSTLAERLQLEKEKLSLQKVQLEQELIHDKATAESNRNKQELVYRDKINNLEEDKKRMESHFKEREFERKDYYDDRGSKRKDYSEATKWLPAIISAMGVMFGILT